MKTISLLLVVCVCGAACSEGDDEDARVVDGPLRDAPASDAGLDATSDGPTDATTTTSCAPTLDDCATGRFWADCGGSGAPRLACAGAQCSWFATSCLPAGYTASDCAADAVCCHDGFPFIKSGATSSRDLALFLQLWAFGSVPWNATREMNIDVVVDGSLTHAATPGFTCTPSGTQGNICDPRTTSAAPRRRSVGDRVTFTLGEEYFPAGTVKIVELDATTRRARVCDYLYTDNLALVCHDFPVSCYTSGTITLSKIPESAAELETIAYRLDVTRDTFRLQGAY